MKDPGGPQIHVFQVQVWKVPRFQAWFGFGRLRGSNSGVQVEVQGQVSSEGSKQLRLPRKGSGKFQTSKRFQVPRFQMRVPSKGSRRAFRVKARLRKALKFQASIQ